MESKESKTTNETKVSAAPRCVPAALRSSALYRGEGAVVGDKVMSPVEILEASIREIQTKLAAPVLDGTPFLLALQQDGATLIYGEWPQGKGFVHEDTVPNHLCGTIQSSETSVREKIAKLCAAGKSATLLHWRDLLGRRLQVQKSLHAALTGKVMAF